MSAASELFRLGNDIVAAIRTVVGAGPVALHEPLLRRQRMGLCQGVPRFELRIDRRKVRRSLRGASWPRSPARNTPSPWSTAPRRCTSGCAWPGCSPATRSLVPAHDLRRHRERGRLLRRRAAFCGQRRARLSDWIRVALREYLRGHRRDARGAVRQPRDGTRDPRTRADARVRASRRYGRLAWPLPGIFTSHCWKTPPSRWVVPSRDAIPVRSG